MRRSPPESRTDSTVNLSAAEVLDLLAAREGHFKLESGHHGNLWLDLDQLFVRPREVHRLALNLAMRLAHYEITAVCGPLVGGAMIAQSIATALDAEFYYTERSISARGEALYPVEYRIPKSLRGRLAGKQVAIIDDVINAGSAVRKTLGELQACGAEPIVIGALMVLGTAAATFCAGQNIPLESLAQYQSSLWLPSECPLCAAHIPLENLTPEPR